MNSRSQVRFRLRLVVPVLLAFLLPSLAASGEFTHGVIASAHPAASDAGLRVLQSGGNAVDAAVAVAFTLGVVDGSNSGIGGGCFMLIRRANGSVIALDGRETAPARSSPAMFLREGKADTALSQVGALASGVPGALAAYDYAVRHYGRKKLSALLLPAAQLAESGFLIDTNYAATLRSVRAELGQFPDSRKIFFDGETPLDAGNILRQPDLAATYRSIARHGAAWFYDGPFSKALETWMNRNEGVMSARDLRRYRPELRQPIRSEYRGYEIIGFPPPSSGGVHVAEMLNILERFPVKTLDDGTRLHLVAETMKLAFADRAYWLGDPAFSKVPAGLVDKTYAASLAGSISLTAATPVKQHGTPPDSDSRFFRKHTTHFSVADSEGNWVACTATLNTAFGSKVVIPGTGVVMNNQMDDFALQPGVTNYFGLLGAEANAIAPGKRPLSSMTPTLVVKDGQVLAALGASGGPKIISAVLQQLVSMLDLGLGPAEAISRPRVHQQWFPDQLFVEPGLPDAVRSDLHRRGHNIEEVKALGLLQVVARARGGGGFLGAADPRGHGAVAGW